MDNNTFKNIVENEVLPELNLVNLLRPMFNNIVFLKDKKSFRMLASFIELQYFEFVPHWIERVISVKAAEYTENNDRLSNFAPKYEFNRRTHIDNLLAYMSKHLTSVLDTLYHRGEMSTDFINEKMGDIYCYSLIALVILTAGVDDENNND